MDIPALSMHMASTKLNTSVNIALIVKAKEQMQTQADDLMKMFEASSVGSTGVLDVKI